MWNANTDLSLGTPPFVLGRPIGYRGNLPPEVLRLSADGMVHVENQLRENYSILDALPGGANIPRNAFSETAADSGNLRLARYPANRQDAEETRQATGLNRFLYPLFGLRLLP